MPARHLYEVGYALIQGLPKYQLYQGHSYGKTVLATLTALLMTLGNPHIRHRLKDGLNNLRPRQPHM